MTLLEPAGNLGVVEIREGRRGASSHEAWMILKIRGLSETVAERDVHERKIPGLFARCA